jgi:hypothetical protein
VVTLLYSGRNQFESRSKNLYGNSAESWLQAKLLCPTTLIKNGIAVNIFTRMGQFRKQMSVFCGIVPCRSLPTFQSNLLPPSSGISPQPLSSVGINIFRMLVITILEKQFVIGLVQFWTWVRNQYSLTKTSLGLLVTNSCTFTVNTRKKFECVQLFSRQKHSSLSLTRLGVWSGHCFGTLP